MSIQRDTDKWYALQVRARWEGSTATLLSGKGYQTLLPTFKAQKRWNGKVRETIEPLFPGYVFCQFDVHNRLPILITQGVLAVVGRGRTPVPVEDFEMMALQRMIDSNSKAEPWPYLEVGQQVRIEEGALNGLEGILVSLKGSNRIVVSVTLLQRSVALEIDRFSIVPVQLSRRVSLESLSAPAPIEGVLA